MIYQWNVLSIFLNQSSLLIVWLLMSKQCPYGNMKIGFTSAVYTLFPNKIVVSKVLLYICILNFEMTKKIKTWNENYKKKVLNFLRFKKRFRFEHCFVFFCVLSHKIPMEHWTHTPPHALKFWWIEIKVENCLFSYE